MGKGLSVAECHSLTARSVGSCQFVPRTEWEACSVQFSGRVFTCTQFFTAVSYICTFWVCLFCHTYTWEHYFDTRCPFKRALVFQPVIWDCWSAWFLSLGSGSPRCSVDVAGSSGTQPPWCQGSGGHEGLLLTQQSQWLHRMCVGIVWHGSIQRLSPLKVSPWHDIPSSKCAILARVV